MYCRSIKVTRNLQIKTKKFRYFTLKRFCILTVTFSLGSSSNEFSGDILNISSMETLVFLFWAEAFFALEYQQEGMQRKQKGNDMPNLLGKTFSKYQMSGKYRRNVQHSMAISTEPTFSSSPNMLACKLSKPRERSLRSYWNMTCRAKLRAGLGRTQMKYLKLVGIASQKFIPDANHFENVHKHLN